MYYVVAEYYVESGCELLEIVENPTQEQLSVMDVRLSSENYDVCSEFVDSYHEELNEQIELSELNKG